MTYPPPNEHAALSQDVRELRVAVQAMERSTDSKIDTLIVTLADINTKIALLNADRQHHDKWHETQEARQLLTQDKRDSSYLAIAIAVLANIVVLIVSFVPH